MATWNNSMTLEVTLHWITPHKTLGKATRQMTIGSDAVWIGTNGNWKAEYSFYDGHHLLIEGKCTYTNKNVIHTSTHKIKVFDNGWREYVKAKVVAYS